MDPLRFSVNGIPGAQGSKRHVGNGVMVESSKKVKPWRSDVRDAAEKAAAVHPDWCGPIGVAVEALVTFRFARPKSHYRTGRNAHLLRDAAPRRPSTKTHGDIDKLLRSTFDALTTSGVITDDALIVDVASRKVWCKPGEAPGATVVLQLADDDEDEAVSAA